MFIVNPSVLHVCSSLVNEPIIYPLIGVPETADEGYIAFYSNSENSWVMVNGGRYPWDMTVTFKEDPMYPVGVPIHGMPAWIGGTNCLFFDPYYNTWVIKPRAMIGMIYKFDIDVFWWRADLDNPNQGDNVADLFFEGQGLAEDDNQWTNRNDWLCWKCDTKYGIYKPFYAATEDKQIGVPYWKDEDGVEYIRSNTKNSDGFFDYSPALYNPTIGKWVIGILGSDSGWWEGTITETDDATFSFNTPPESPESPEAPESPEGEPKLLSFSGFTAGNEYEESTKIAEVSIWR